MRRLIWVYVGRICFEGTFSDVVTHTCNKRVNGLINLTGVQYVTILWCSLLGFRHVQKLNISVTTGNAPNSPLRDPPHIRLSRGTAFPTRLHVRPAKIQISLRIGGVWSVSSLSSRRRIGSLATHRVSCEDSDQTARSAGSSGFSLGAHAILLKFLCPGS